MAVHVAEHVCYLCLQFVQQSCFTASTFSWSSVNNSKNFLELSEELQGVQRGYGDYEGL